MLTLAVLGPVDLRRDGVALRVPGGKSAELLVRLALDAGNPVRAERLLEDLWPSPVHAAAANTLQAKVSRVRRALGDPQLLRGDGAGYTLTLNPQAVDAVQVLRLAERATMLRASRDHGRMVAVCEQGLAMFHGDVLPGAGDAAWAHPHRVRLEATRLRLAEDRLAAKTALGAAGDIVTELEDMVAAHPLRESLWVLLVTALYRAGRQGDALAACARVRHQLAEDLGIDPGAELQTLEQQVLRHDPALTAPPRTATTGSGLGVRGEQRAALGNLPVAAGSLVGRDADLARLLSLMAQQRLVTLTGPAGVGKTRLALEAADQSSPLGGSWLARLETAPNTASVWHSIGEALGVDAPTPVGVTERLRGAELLLVLDNCEHLVGPVAACVNVLLSAAPRVRVLATSQVPLRAAGELDMAIEPLSLADSVTLFTVRASAQHLYPTDDEQTRHTVEEVCRSLDGLPLAIELAAARTRVLPVHEIARRLKDRFSLLRDPTSQLPARQATLRAALSWSYDLLFPDDQRGLWALAAFTGGASLPTLEAVLGALDVPPDDGLDIVSRLVDRSLATVEIHARGPARYHLLDSVRALSLERLHEAGVGEVVASAHAQWFAEAADRAATGVRGPGQPEHLDLVRAERANIDSALDWCGTHDPDMGVRIAVGFGWAWVVLGAGVEGAHRIRGALDAAPGTARSDRAAALTLCGWFEASGGNLGQAEADLEEAIRVGDSQAGAVAKLYLAFVHTQGGRPADALNLLQACRGDLRQFGLEWEEGASWLLGAWAHIASGDTTAGKAACDEALNLLRPVGDGWALAHAEGLLGELAQAECRYGDATAHLAAAAAAANALGFEAAQAHHLLNLGRAQQQAGDAATSQTTLALAIDIGLRCGDTRTVAFARTRLAQVLRAVGETDAAFTQAMQAVDWFSAAGGGDGARLADFLIAALHGDDGAPGAIEQLNAVLIQARDAADPVVEILALDALAALESRAGHVDEPMARFRAADGLAAATPILWAGDRLDSARTRAAFISGGRDRATSAS